MEEDPDIHEDLCERTMAYLRTAPDSPVKALVDDLRKAMAFTKQGLVQAIETVDELERTVQDHEAEDRYMPIRCRLKADGQLIIFSTDDGTEGCRMFSHLIRQGYQPVEPSDPRALEYLEDADDHYTPYWNPDEEDEDDEYI